MQFGCITDQFLYVLVNTKLFLRVTVSQEAVKETEECEQEIEKLKQFLKNHLAEKSHEYQPQTQKTSCPEVGFMSCPKFMTMCSTEK